MRVYGLRPAGRTADGGSAARRGTASRRRESAGGYFGPPRHDADRSAKRAEAGRVVLSPHGEEPRFLRGVSNHAAPDVAILRDAGKRPLLMDEVRRCGDSSDYLAGLSARASCR